MVKKCPRCGVQYTKDALRMFENTVKAGFKINLTCGNCGAAMLIDESQVDSGQSSGDSGQSPGTDTPAQPPAEGSKGCFIATACFGNADAPEVAALRAFRDNSLLPDPMGRAATRIYYAISPPLARWLERSPRAASFIRERVLRPFVRHISGRAAARPNKPPGDDA